MAETHTHGLDFTSPMFTHPEMELLTTADQYMKSSETGQELFPDLLNPNELMAVASLINDVESTRLQAVTDDAVTELTTALAQYDAQAGAGARKHVREHETVASNLDFVFGLSLSTREVAVDVDTGMLEQLNSARDIANAPVQDMVDGVGAQERVLEQFDVVTAHHRTTDTNGDVTVNCAGFKQSFPQYDLLFYFRDVDLESVLPQGIHAWTVEDTRELLTTYLLQKANIISRLQSPEQGVNHEAVENLTRFYIYPYTHIITEYDKLYDLTGTNEFEHDQAAEFAAMLDDDKTVRYFTPYFGGPPPEHESFAELAGVRSQDTAKPDGSATDVDSDDFTDIDIE